MASLNKDLIKKNIFKLLDYSGVTDISFAYLLSVSDKQIKRIRKGQAEFSIDNINKACDFFDISVLSLNSANLYIDQQFRSKLIKKHRGNDEYIKLLIDRPSISYAIKYELLQNDKFIDKSLTVKQIREIFEAKGWSFTSAYISLSLKRNSHFFEVTINPTKKGTFLYSKK